MKHAKETLTAQWLCVPSIGRILQPFTGNGGVCIRVKRSRVGRKQTNQFIFHVNEFSVLIRAKFNKNQPDGYMQGTRFWNSSPVLILKSHVHNFNLEVRMHSNETEVMRN